MVSLFFAWHDQYFVMFEDSNFWEFTNFQFKTKYNTAVYSVNSNYLFSREKQEKKLLKQFFLNLLSLFINVPPQLDDF